MTANDPQETPAVIGFWRWLLFRDSEGDRGIGNILNRWLLFHVVIGLALGWLARPDSGEIAKTIALPGAAILVGLSFAWAGRSANLLQERGFSAFLIENGPPAEGYVYSFQLAILSVIAFVLISLVLMLGGLDISLGSGPRDQFANKSLLFIVGSVALRECWGVILFVNKLTIQYYYYREIEDARDQDHS